MFRTSSGGSIQTALICVLGLNSPSHHLIEPLST